MGKSKHNYKFEDSMLVNDLTYIDYLERFKKIALSMFEWVNLPNSMNSMFLEKCLYYLGQASLLYHNEYGFINTKCCSSGEINIYDLPTKLNCYAYNFNSMRKLYTGLTEYSKDNNECILVQNNWERIPTAPTLELFAYRLYMAERSIDVNISAQRTPVLLLVDEKKRLTIENLYNQYNGNQPFIFGDNLQLKGNEQIKAINTEASFVADKLQDYKKEIWNEALTFLGVNNIMIDKKERLVSDEANSNNELINLNLQSYLAPRQYACKQFNEKFGFTGTDKEISVRVRSDLHNTIKNAESVINDYIVTNNTLDKIQNINEEGVQNG